MISRAVLAGSLIGVVVSVSPVPGQQQPPTPSYDEVSLRAALLDHYRARHLEAVQETLALARQQLGDVPGILRIDGIAALDAGLPDLAVEQLTLCVQRDPEDYFGWVHLSRAIGARNPKEGGEEEARRAIALRPDLHWGYLQLADLYLDRAQVDESIAALEVGLQRAALAENPELQERQCDTLLVAGRYELAFPAAVHLIEQHSSRPRGHYLLGLVLGNRGEHDKAVPCFRRAIEQAPENAEYHLQLGIVLRRLGKHDEALAALLEAKRLDPEDPRTRYNLSQTLVRLGRVSEAYGEKNAYRRLHELSARKGGGS